MTFLVNGSSGVKRPGGTSLRNYTFVWADGAYAGPFPIDVGAGETLLLHAVSQLGFEPYAITADGSQVSPSVDQWAGFALDAIEGLDAGSHEIGVIVDGSADPPSYAGSLIVMVLSASAVTVTRFS